MIITEELINSFIEFWKNQWLKDKTLYTYRYNFMAFYHWLKANKGDKLEDIDKLTIEEYKAFLFSLWGSKYGRYWIQEHLSSWTINQKLVVIKKFLEFTNYVYDLGLDSDKVRLNRVKYRTWDYFTEDEIKEIIKAIQHTEKYKINQLRLKLIIAICFVSWARLNEMRQIRIQDIYNWKCKILWKWDKERWIFFNQDCINILNEYIEEQKKDIPWLQKKLTRKNDYAVCSHGYENFWEMIWKQAITEMFKKLNKFLKRTKTITCHTLRHSFATKMVDSGTNVFYLKELMGHEKINTTAWYYHRNRNILATEQNKVFAEFSI